MAQITWRNVDPPNLGDPFRSLQGAQGSFNQAFQNLGDILKSYQDMNVANAGVLRGNNTEDVFSRVAAKYNTPEAFKAGMDSGEIPALVASYQGALDRPAVRQFLDARGTKLIQDATLQNTYTDQVTERALQPKVQQAQALAAKGDKAGFDAYMAANPDLARHIGTLTQAAVTGQRAAQQFTWAGENQDFARRDQVLQEEEGKRKADLFPLEQEKIRAAIRASDASAGRDRISGQLASAQLRATQAELARGDKLAKEARDLIVKNGPLGGGVLGVGDGMLQLQKGMKDMPGVSDKQAEVIQAKLQQWAAEGGVPVKGADGKITRFPVSVSAALSAISSTGSNLYPASFFRGAGRAADVEEALLKTYQNPEFLQSLGQSMQALGMTPSEAKAPEPTGVQALMERVRSKSPVTAAPAETPSVKLPDQFKTGNAALDKAFSEEVWRRAQTAIPGVVVTNGVLDARSNPDLLLQIRNQVAASMPKPTPAEKKSPK